MQPHFQVSWDTEYIAVYNGLKSKNPVWPKKKIAQMPHKLQELWHVSVLLQLMKSMRQSYHKDDQF